MDALRNRKSFKMPTDAWSNASNAESPFKISRAGQILQAFIDKDGSRDGFMIGTTDCQGTERLVDAKPLLVASVPWAIHSRYFTRLRVT
jgi:hypothetical protein